ncbi:mersacidin/lichenicidin family type 2 lantibiotic [Cyanobacteria bacterium FACHB-DQ100]|nr:mersacidin/lichenicidin family type 2 lantibiotic [Cyanobacteria bacterium FACHB-DQ100]
MSTFDIIRAWKDEDYRLSLTDAQRAMLPDSPVGLVELSDADMGMLAGGTGYPSTCDPCDPCCEQPSKHPGSNGRGVAKGCKKW